MEITTRTTPSPKGVITLYRFTDNITEASVELSTLGAGITSVRMPDRNGKVDEIALSYPDPASWLYDGPCAGKTVGRYANRIGGAKFTIDSTEYTIDANDRGHSALHGGKEGFQNQIWDAQLKPDGVTFRYRATDGEEGYPGHLDVIADYTLIPSAEGFEIRISFSAVTDKPTLLNLTNHAYWNLRGESSGDCLDHIVTIRAERYAASDEWLVPTGELKSVCGNPMDFRTPKALGKEFHEPFEVLVFDHGYDTSYMIDGWQPKDADANGTPIKSGTMISEAVAIECPVSGRRVAIDSTLPAAHLYTGNWLDDSPVGISGRRYRNYDAVAVEMQFPPDCPNHPNFPDTVLRPGQRYEHTIVYRFSVK